MTRIYAQLKITNGLFGLVFGFPITTTIAYVLGNLDGVGRSGTCTINEVPVLNYLIKALT